MKKLGAAGLLLLFATSVPVGATSIGGSVTGGTALAAGGTFIKLTVPLSNPFGPPNSVGNDTFQSPNLYEFDEDQNILLAAPLTVDVGSSPIPAGTIVASHYVFFDPGPSQHIIGTVNFDSIILGIITSTNNLAASDFLGAGRFVHHKWAEPDPLRYICQFPWGLCSRADRVLAGSDHSGTWQPCIVGSRAHSAGRAARPEMADFRVP